MWASEVRGHVVLLAGLALMVGACTAILGDDFTIEDETTVTGTASAVGGGGSTATGSGVGGGGTGGTSTASGGTGGTSSGSTGGSGGGSGGTGGQGPCQVGDMGVCGSGMKCSVIDVQTGETDCVVAGSHAAWTTCGIDTQCEEGTWCDVFNQVCRPVCPPASCANGGQCVAATSSSGAIPGLTVCSSNCHPVFVDVCQNTYDTTTCVLMTYGFDCARAGFNTFSCSGAFDCVPGYYCSGSPYWNCYEWCRIGHVEDCDGGGDTCAPRSPKIYHNGNELGTCTVG